MDHDAYWMQRALALGKQGIGSTSPNPPVGALIVKDEIELGGGWHHGPGQAHAEIEAMQAAHQKHGETCCKGATLYVTLEPCSTHGRTGPCTEAIVKDGIARVVYGTEDPNPNHVGLAESILSEAGLAVRCGVHEADCQELIRPFAKVQRTGLPWVIIKSAMSLDGRITRPTSEGQWLSGKASRAEVQQLRGEVDAVLTSGRTVRADNPSLTVRDRPLAPGEQQPWRVVLTTKDDGVPAAAALHHDPHSERTLIFKGRRIENVLRDLVSERGVCSVLVEAGGRLLGRFLDEGWADEAVIYLAPLVTGGEVPSVGGEGAASLADRLRLEEVRFDRFDDDVRLRGLLRGRGDTLER